MADFTRLDYAGLEWQWCPECGEAELLVHFPTGRAICSQCKERLNIEVAGPFTKHTFYRALRPDENPSDGLFPKDPDASVPLEEHVDNGSFRGSQFISTSQNVQVAMFFAIKGALERDDFARVAEIEIYRQDHTIDEDPVAMHFANFEAEGTTRAWSFRATNYARLFDEVCFEGCIPAR